MAAFPSYAKLLREGFARAPGPVVERSEMQSGPPKQRRNASRAMWRLPVRYLLATKADYVSFVTWFESTVQAGAAWFDWTDPLDGTVRQARIVGGAIDPQPQRKDQEIWIVAFELEYWGT